MHENIVLIDNSLSDNNGKQAKLEKNEEMPIPAVNLTKKSEDTNKKNNIEINDFTTGNTSLLESSINILTNNKFVKFIKKDNDTNNLDSSSFFSNKTEKSENSENQNLKDFLVTPYKKSPSDLEKMKTHIKIEKNFKSNDTNEFGDFYELNELVQQDEQNKKEIDNIDSDMDLDAFEIIK